MQLRHSGDGRSALRQLLNSCGKLDKIGGDDLPVAGGLKIRCLAGAMLLRPGDEVLQIVPTGQQLIVEAQVPPRDIAFVRIGQRARVNFDAYDSAIYGSGEGEVVLISPDTLTEERSDGTTHTYYRVTLEVDTASMRPRHAGETIDLQPGLTATAEILTGSQTVWEYITKPILRTTRQSLQER